MSVEVVLTYTRSIPLDPMTLGDPIKQATTARGHLRVSPTMYQEIRRTCAPGNHGTPDFTTGKFGSLAGVTVVPDDDVPDDQIQVAIQKP